MRDRHVLAACLHESYALHLFPGAMAMWSMLRFPPGRAKVVKTLFPTWRHGPHFIPTWLWRREPKLHFSHGAMVM